MCSALEQLSWAFNSYYMHQGMKDTACDFGGNAQIQNPQAPSGNCGNLIGQVGSAGTGTVTSMPSGTGGAGSGGGAASTTTKKAAAVMMTVPSLDMGMLTMGAYLVGAVFTGLAIIIL